MHRSPQTCRVVSCALAGLLVSGACLCAQTRSNRADSKPDSKLLQRGQYIVESVAMCGQCHTPRDSNGVPDRSKELNGAALWINPAAPSVNWPLQAPRIAGNPPGTDEEMIRLLTTGIWRDGNRLRPPMPQFRLSREDAEAVVAFLKSLNREPE